MLAELPVRSQICGNGRQEADWKCGTACYGKDPVGDGQGRFVEGRWSVVVCGAGKLEVKSFGSLILIGWMMPGNGHHVVPVAIDSQYVPFQL